MANIKYRDIVQRLVALSVVDDEVNEYTGSPCWHWTGAKVKAFYSYYPRINIHEGGKKFCKLAHRVAYAAFKEVEIFDDVEVDHLCFNTLCINPAHLEAVTRSENLSRRR